MIVSSPDNEQLFGPVLTRLGGLGVLLAAW